MKDDIKYRIGSTAVAFGDHLKLFLWIMLLAIYSFLTASQVVCKFGDWYCLFSVFGSTGSLAVFIYRLDLKSASSCWSAFTNSFWYLGGSITTGLLLEYLTD